MLMIIHQGSGWAVMSYEDTMGRFFTHVMINNVWHNAAISESEEQAIASHMAEISKLSNDSPVKCFSM